MGRKEKEEGGMGKDEGEGNGEKDKGKEGMVKEEYERNGERERKRKVRREW